MTLSRTAFVYNGKAQKPSVTVKAGSKKLAAANYTLTYSKGRANVGTYKVVVKLKGNYSGSRTVSFKILPKGTSLSSVQAGSNRMQVTWKKQAVQVRGYQIQYSGRSDFSKAATVTIANTNAVSRTVGNLTKGTVYYVRVRTYKTVGGTNYYSSWSSARSVRITAGTATIFTQTPSVSIKAESDTMANTLTWKKLSGATGYEISYKKGDNGNWGVLKRITQTKITHKVTHGVYYYYRVRAYKDKADGSRIYSSYSAEKSMMHYYKPSYRTYITDRSDADTLYFMMAIENTGSCNLRIYSRNARLIDRDYTSFNRDMYLIDNEEMLNNKTLKGISSLVIKPGEIKIVTFWVEGNNSTLVDNKSTLYYEFNYDGVDYYAYTSKYYGTSFYEDH